LTTDLPKISVIFLIIGIDLLTGFVLAFRSYRVKSQNLGFLAGFSFSSIFVSIFYGLGDSLFRHLGFTVSVFLANFFLLVFTNRTFFTDKKSPFFRFFLIIFTASLIHAVLRILDLFPGEWQMTAFYNILISIIMAIPGYWFGYLVIKQYRSIKMENIEPWIKMRFLIAGIGALLNGSVGWLAYLIVISQIPGVDPAGNLELITLLISALILITFSIGFFIAFVMPERMKQYFNRNYKPTDEETLSEEEIMKHMGAD